MEAAMIWNEPNNKSHWDSEADPEWAIFGRMATLAGQAIAAEAPGLPRVLGGMSPIDPGFLTRLSEHGALSELDAVAVHGFPLDWNHWLIEEWPDKLKLIAAQTDLPVWVSEVGVSTFGAEEVQAWGLRRSFELLRRPRPAHPLVQPVRPAFRLARDHPAPGSRRVLVLPALPHGAGGRTRPAQAGGEDLP